MKKCKSIIFTLLFSIIMSSSSVCFAAEQPGTTEKGYYDLDIGGTQTFYVKEADGNTGIVIVSEESSITRVENGTYNVKYTSTGCWTAGYKVKISGNNIVSAFSPYATKKKKKIDMGRLKLESNKQATLYLTYYAGIIGKSTGVRANIQGTKMHIKMI